MSRGKNDEYEPSMIFNIAPPLLPSSASVLVRYVHSVCKCSVKSVLRILCTTLRLWSLVKGRPGNIPQRMPLWQRVEIGQPLNSNSSPWCASPGYGIVRKSKRWQVRRPIPRLACPCSYLQSCPTSRWRLPANRRPGPATSSGRIQSTLNSASGPKRLRFDTGADSGIHGVASGARRLCGIASVSVDIPIPTRPAQINRPSGS